MAARIAGQLELLKDKDHQRRQLVAQVSHDLRTPLASIQGYLETLGMKQQELSPDERRRFLNVALAETLRLSKLVDELFELAALMPANGSLCRAVHASRTAARCGAKAQTEGRAGKRCA